MEEWRRLHQAESSGGGRSVVVPYLSDALLWLLENRNTGVPIPSARPLDLDQLVLGGEESRPERLDSAKEVHVLVTGSLWLVGSVLEQASFISSNFNLTCLIV